MNWNTLVRADFGRDLPIKAEYAFRERLFGFLTLCRPIFIFMTPLNAGSAAVLSISGYPSWRICLAGLLTAAFASAGVNTFNRFADRDRDKTAWPWRPIPSGRVKARYALALTIVLYSISLLLCWSYFNPTTFVILLAGIVLGSLYSTYFRDKIGYLSLPPIEGLIFLAGWAALSPDTILTLTPWVLYVIGLTWQAAHIMAHYLLHIKYDDAGKPVITTPALFWKPSPKAASMLVLAFIAACFAMSLWLVRLTKLNYVFVILILIIGLVTLFRTLSLVDDNQNKEKLHKAWSSLSLFRLISSVAILLSILVYTL
jgi:4-hydroxybenzoate polyprenyltransferase